MIGIATICDNRSDMKPTLGMIGVATLMTGLSLVASGTPLAETTSPMPVQQQNELVRQRCAPCHSGATPKGGLLLEHFDAAAPDPAVARLMLIKIARDAAIMAAGKPVPDDTTRDS